MAQNSKIEWTEHTANLWHGCTKVHEGCDNCYAETLSKRWGNDVWGNDKPRKAINSVWSDLDKYQRLAKQANAIHRVFVGSMMDIFEKPMPLIDSNGEPLVFNTESLRDRLFAAISGNKYPNLIFLLLTKRPSNINKYTPESWKDNPPKNVMFGTSPVNQETSNTLIRQLLQVNGKRFLSVEPQLDSISFRWAGWFDYKNKDNGTKIIFEGGQVNSYGQYDGIRGIHWIIQGGESGHRKRPFNLDWAYQMKKECLEAGVPYFFKQIDKVQTIPEDLLIRQFPNL